MDRSNDSPKRRCYLCNNCKETFKDSESLDEHKADSRICFQLPASKVTFGKIKALSEASQKEIEMLTNEATTTEIRLLVQPLKSAMVSKFSAFEAYFKENKEVKDVAYCFRERVRHKKEVCKIYEKIPSMAETLKKNSEEQLTILNKKADILAEIKTALDHERDEMLKIGRVLGKQKAANAAAVKATQEEQEAFLLLDEAVKASTEQTLQNNSLLIPKSFTSAMHQVRILLRRGQDTLKELQSEATIQQTSLSAVQAALTREPTPVPSTPRTSQNTPCAFQ